jgi:hypothetical protein
VTEPKAPAPVSLSIPEAQLYALISAAIYENLDAETKKNIMTVAITHIMTPRKSSDSYNYGRVEDSPLQSAFKAAADRAATQVVNEMLSDPKGPYRAKIKAAVEGALYKLFEDKEAMVDRLAKDLQSALHSFIFRKED